MNFEDAILEVSVELDIPKHVCREAYMSMWKFIRQQAQSLPLKEDLTDEQFLQLRPNFNLPSLGKLFVTKDNYRRKKELYHYLNSKKLQENGNNIQNNEA